MGYALPTNTDYVSSSQPDHINRRPPSQEPGTDYGAAYGSPLYAVGDGVVVDTKSSNSNPTGRYITIDLDDGRRTRSLHLSQVGRSAGQRVSRGELIGATGASANGSDWGVGAHVHQTLWPTHAYVFGPYGTLNFENYVGGNEPAPTQRKAGPNGVNGRAEPSASAAKKQFLDPGAIGDFNGWITGEAVEGNSTWFRGAHSGDWFWSGGFTDSGTHDLPDLNPAKPIGPTQREAGPNGVNGRAESNTAAAIVTDLAPGTIGDFDGWMNGENVEGQPVWFRGAHSAAWFWAGGFNDQGTHDLADLNPAPPADPNRTVAVATNVRTAPSTSAAIVGSEEAGAVVKMDAWTTGEKVEGNDVWFRRAVGGWAWSGGFTSQSTDSLPKVAPPTPTNPNNPRGLPEYPPVYPGASFGLEAPLGFTDCENPVTRSPRNTKGDPPVETSGVISLFIIHYTDATNDQVSYFSYCNDRNSCPSLYIRNDTDSTMFEMIRPGAKPAATGPEYNWRSISVELQCVTKGPEGKVTDGQLEKVAVAIADLAEYDGKTFDGSPVDFKIDRKHVISHQEALPGTECPGQYVQARMDSIVARAQEIYDERHPKPKGYWVPKDLGDQIRTLVNEAFPAE